MLAPCDIKLMSPDSEASCLNLHHVFLAMFAKYCYIMMFIDFFNKTYEILIVEA